MPLKTIETRIDGTDYRISQLPWLEGVPVFSAIVGAAGELVTEALLTMKGEKLEKFVAGDAAAVMPILAKIFGSLPQDDLKTIVHGLGRCIEVRVGETDAWTPVMGQSAAFSGNYTHMLRVLFEAARHNFAGPT